MELDDRHSRPVAISATNHSVNRPVGATRARPERAELLPLPQRMDIQPPRPRWTHRLTAAGGILFAGLWFGGLGVSGGFPEPATSDAAYYAENATRYWAGDHLIRLSILSLILFLGGLWSLMRRHESRAGGCRRLRSAAVCWSPGSTSRFSPFLMLRARWGLARAGRRRSGGAHSHLVSIPTSSRCCMGWLAL